MSHEHGDHSNPSQEEIEAFYAQGDRLWSGNPNESLVGAVSDLAPGSALDIGCGEGADAVWLASQGWSITAIDYAPTAVDRARAALDAAGFADAETEAVAFAELASREDRTFDLVSCAYGQLPADATAMESLFSLVAPGGTLFLVHHDMESESVAMPRWVATQLPEDFEVARLDSSSRNVEGGAGSAHDVDVILLARRRS